MNDAIKTTLTQSIKIFLALILLHTIAAWSINISTWHASYKTTEIVWIKLDNKPGNAKDWIGIYPKDCNSTQENIIKRKWAHKDSKKYPTWYSFSNLKEGEYEARFFLNNTFKIEAKVAFSVKSKRICYHVKQEDNLTKIFNTHTCVQIDGIYELNNSISIENKNLTVRGGTLKTMNHNVILNIKESNITFDSITFDFNEKEFYDKNVCAPIVVDENLKNIYFKNTTFKNIKAIPRGFRGSSSKIQQYAIQASINNLTLTINHCRFKHFHTTTKSTIFSGFVGGIFISSLGMKSNYTIGGEIAILNSTFEDMRTTRDDYFKQENADGIRSYAPKLSKKEQVGTTVRVENSIFRNISQSSIKLGAVKAIIRGCKTYNDTKHSQYAAYRSNNTQSFTVDNVEAYGNITNMLVVSGENIKLSNIKNYTTNHKGSTILLGLSQHTKNTIIEHVKEKKKWTSIYLYNTENTYISDVTSKYKLFRFKHAIDTTFDKISEQNATFIPRRIPQLIRKPYKKGNE